ncbi:scrFIAM [Symbiodinium sp. CCMP2456]|nr:scrFIAM [Symbiodinium sp. CCMP2456]
MKDGLLHTAKVSEDVCQYNGTHTDAVGCGGGFPCQGVSVAGHQAGMSDARTGLVRHVFRIWDTLQPQRRSGCVRGLGFTLYLFRVSGCRV